MLFGRDRASAQRSADAHARTFVRVSAEATLVLALLTGITTAVWRWGIVASWAPQGSWTPGFGDLTAYFFPKWVHGTAAVLSGRIPLWNPLELCGLPFLATAQVAALYPVKILVFALFPPADAIEVNTVVHLILAGTFEYAYARWLGMRPVAALVAGLTWAFSAPMLRISHPNQLMCLSWMPLIVLAYERALVRRTVGATATVGVVVAMQIMAGYPLYGLCTAVVLAVWTLGWLACGRSWRSWAGTLAVAAGVLLFVAGFSAPQILPLRELLPETMRAEIVAPWGVPSGVDLAAVPRELAAVVWKVFSNPLAGLALLGLVLGRGRQRWLLVAALFCCHAAGHGLSPLIRFVPGFREARLLFVMFDNFFPFFIATLAAIGLDRAAARARGLRLLLALSCLIAPLAVRWVVYLPQRVLDIAALPEGVAVQLRSTTLASTFGKWLGATSIVLPLLPRPTSAAVVALVIGGIGIAGSLQSYWAMGPLGPYPRNGPDPRLRGIVSILAPGGRATSQALALDGTLIMSNIPNVLGDEGSLPPRRIGRLLEAAGMGPEALLLGADWARAAQHQPLLELIALSVVVTSQPMPNLEELGFASPMWFRKGQLVYR